MLQHARSAVLLALLAALLAAPATAQADFRNYESAQVHPIRLSADGTRLFAVNTPDGRLEVYGLADPSHPVLLRDIPVGLEPVSVTPRTNDEVWVVNNLSDSVSVVSVSAGRVVATLRVKDEPADVAFAMGKAFVTASASDEVHVFDAQTRASLGTVSIAGKDPRALAVAPGGGSVYVLVHRSGNGTTLIREQQAPPPPPPTGPLPAAPSQGIIVRADDPNWSHVVSLSLPDEDVFEISASSLQVMRTFSSVGTILFDLAVHPQSGDLFVAGTDARNLVRFEDALQSHTIDSRVTRVTPGPSPTVQPFDLNPGFTYANLPNQGERALALAEPTGIALDAAAGRLYVAAHGTDRIGVLDLAGNVLARIEVGDATGGQLDTLNKRGPRGLAFHASAQRLYVLNRLSHSIAVIDTLAGAKLAEWPLAFDPTPQAVRDGRKFQYDAKLAGNGTASCASCHIDSDIDGLAWDLGVKDGTMTNPPSQPFPFNVGLTQYHPMKGPMTTQTLRGLKGMSPFHWRGEKPDLPSFNSGFAGVLGGSLLSPADLALYVAFLESMEFPPNPNQNLDRTYKTTPANANASLGLTNFNKVNGLLSCVGCHSLPSGSNRMVISAQALNEPQQQKVPHLRNMYRKQGMTTSGPATAGFGFVHDGAEADLTEFLNLPVFNSWPSEDKPHIVAFLDAFDTGTAPAVGYQVTVDAGNAAGAGVGSDVSLLQSQAAAGNIDLVAHGTLGGVERGLAYDPSSGSYAADANGVGPYTWNDLKAQAQAGQAVWTLTGTPPGSGQRIGRDRDRDGTPNGSDGVELVEPAVAGCAGTPHAFVNSEPRIGNAGFAFVCSGLPPGLSGTLMLDRIGAPYPGRGQPFFGTSVHAPFGGAAVTADAEGFAWVERPIPDDPALIGRTFLAVGQFPDGCAQPGRMKSETWVVTIRP